MLERLIFFQECACRNRVLQIVQVSGARSTDFGDVHMPLLPQRLLKVEELFDFDWDFWRQQKIKTIVVLIDTFGVSGGCILQRGDLNL